MIEIPCVINAQIRSFFWSVFSPIRTEYGDLYWKYGPEKNPYLDTFQAMHSVRKIKRSQNTFLKKFATLQVIILDWQLHGNKKNTNTVSC